MPALKGLVQFARVQLLETNEVAKVLSWLPSPLDRSLAAHPHSLVHLVRLG